MPPRGYQYVVTTTLQSDCTLVTSRPVLMAAPTGSGAPASSASGLQATSYYRLWDPANKLLNASYTTMNWSTSNGRISSASTVIHDYWAPDGWYQLNLWDNWNGGCVVCTWIAAEGYAFLYFAPGPVWQNEDWNFITAQGNSSYSNCYSSWHWTLGFPFWHTQTFCAWGYNP